MKHAIWILVPALALCGCGQKGPLYLPEHNEAVITSPVETSTEATAQPLPPESGSSASSSAPRSSASSSSSSSSP